MPVAAYLSGATRQGRIGVGYATLRDAMGTTAAEPSITVLELDHTLDKLQWRSRNTREAGGAAVPDGTGNRARTAFLVALLVGELRQGALEGVMIDALAKACGLPADRVRRAVMMAGDFAAVAKAVLDRRRSSAVAI